MPLILILNSRIDVYKRQLFSFCVYCRFAGMPGSGCNRLPFYRLLCSLLFLRRMYSPTLVIHTRVVTRNSPGIRMIHQELDNRAFCERDIMLPQEMISMGRPIPRKLKVASVPIAALTLDVYKRQVPESVHPLCRQLSYGNNSDPL